MKKVSITLMAMMLVIAVFPISAFAAQGGSQHLLVYSSLPTSRLDMMVDLFEAAYPSIIVDIFSAQTPELLDDIARHAEAPQADLIVGGSLAMYQSLENSLLAYVSPNTQAYYAQYQSPSAKYTAIQVQVGAMLVNRAQAAKLNVRVDGWASLKNEQLKGQVLYANDALTDADAQQASFISSFAQAAGGLALSAPSFIGFSVGEGQFAIGIVNEENALATAAKYDGLQVVYTKEGLPMGAAYAGILQGAQNLANAQLFIDFLASKAYQQAAAERFFQRSVRTDVAFNAAGALPTDQLTALGRDHMLALLGGKEMARQ